MKNNRFDPNFNAKKVSADVLQIVIRCNSKYNDA